jgi:hypothetical protein
VSSLPQAARPTRINRASAPFINEFFITSLPS